MNDDRMEEEPMEAIRRRLDRARRAWRVTEVAGGLLRGLTFLLLTFLIAVVADNLLALPGWARAILLAGFGAGLVYVAVVRTAHSLLRPLTDEMVAVHIERGQTGLENRLINTVLLQKEEFADPLMKRMAASQMDETLHAVRDARLNVATDRFFLRKWGMWTVGLMVITTVYGLVFHERFANALQRYATPTRYVAPITRTMLTVAPGNVELLQGEPLEVEARVDGDMPEKAQIVFKDAQGNVSKPAMPFVGSQFSYRFTSVQASFTYYVTAGDFVSDTYAVNVRTRPSLKQIKLTVAYPAYMGLPEKTEAAPNGNLSAPVGSVVQIEAEADRPVAEAAMEIKFLTAGETEEAPTQAVEMAMAGEKTVKGRFTVTRSGAYSINVKDAAGIANQPLLSQLVALPDEAPAVKLVDPAKDLAVAPDAKVTLLAEAKDDFSLRRMELHVQPKAEAQWARLKEWTWQEPTLLAREGAVLDLASFKLTPGCVVSFYFKADDGCPNREEGAGKTRIFQITIVDKAVALEKEKAQEEAFRTRIQRLITMQKANIEATAQVGKWTEKDGDIARDNAVRQRFATRAGTAVKAQETIYSEARQTATAFAGIEAAEMVHALASIVSREMPKAVDQLAELKNAANVAAIAPAATAAQETQEAIIKLLERLLADPKALMAERVEQEANKEKVNDKHEDLNPDRPRVEKLKETLEQFKQEQKEIIEATKKLADKQVNDFTKADEEAIQKITDAEMKWAKFFQEAATDLSKLPPQDFSLSNMAKELMEVYSEVKKAADADQKKAVEIAVPLEQAGLELASKIETNIEKWLTETPDREQWKMEDPKQDYDVPLAELPDELEDLIGDLMEEEENLLEEAADATSGWLDSLDKGAGWDAMDGPISNMSAKGVTGNRLPDSHEVGGRSGEGRTGKSSGQFVEESAQGKGGRQTPTRMTEDPFEAGVVKDTAPEPGTGSTGGGKASGFGQGGFQGQTPQNAQEKLKRLANMQQQIIDKAARIDHGLKTRNYPRGELPKTIDLMKEVQKDIESGKIVSTAGASQKVVLENLKEVKEVVARQKQVNRDSAAMLPKEIRDEISASLKEDVPKQYKDLVESYYKALAESGSLKAGETGAKAGGK